MKLEQIEYVLEIVKHGSINKAAKALSISQPNLSLSIKSLESEIGFKIFNRKQKGIELTIEGGLFIEHAKNIANSFEFIQNISNLETYDIKNDSIDLTISSQYSSQVFFSLLDLFKCNQFRHINFNLNQINLSQVIEEVVSRRSNLGFIFIDDTNNKLIMDNLKLNGLEFIYLDSPKFYWCLNKVHPLAKNTTISIDEAINFPLATLNFTSQNFLYSSLYINLGMQKFTQKIELTDYHSLLMTLDKLNAIAFIIKFKNTNSYYDLNGIDLVFKDIDQDESVNLKFGYIKPIKSILTQDEIDFIEILKTNLNIK